MLDPSLLASPIVQAFGGLGLVLWIAQLLFTTSIAQAKGLNWFFWGVGRCCFRCWPSWRCSACPIASSAC